MEFTVIEAKGLRANPDIVGSSEPMVTFNFKLDEYKTEPFDTLEPQWNTCFYLYNNCNRPRLTFAEITLDLNRFLLHSIITIKVLDATLSVCADSLRKMLMTKVNVKFL